MNEVKIVIEGLSELTEAIRRLAMQQGGPAASTAGSQAVNMPVSMPPAQTPPMQAPPVPTTQQTPPYLAQQGMPGQNAPMGQGAPMPQVPTTATVQEYTIEQLQVAAAGLTSAGKMPQVMGILQGFGIHAMTELQKGQYAAFAAALREAGAQI